MWNCNKELLLLKSFKMIGIDGFEMLVEAENKQEAYFNFLQECLGIKLTEFQKKDSLRELVMGNYIFDLIECHEVLN